MHIHTRPFSHSVFYLFPFLSFVYIKTVNDLTALCSMAPKLILLKFFFCEIVDVPTKQNTKQSQRQFFRNKNETSQKLHIDGNERIPWHESGNIFQRMPHNIDVTEKEN